MQTTQTAGVAPVHHEQRVESFNGLRSPGWLGRWPLVGMVLVAIGSVVFGGLAAAIQSHNPQLLQNDIQIDDGFHALALHAFPLILPLMIFGYYLGQEIIVAIGAVLVIHFLYKHYWTELWMVLIAWGGEAVIWLLVSNYFNRPRPRFAVVVWHQMTAPSFPSGHSFGAVLCFGLLVYLLVPKMPTLFWKWIAVASGIALIFYVGFSRLFVGDHYPSDILAGYALGVAWGALVYTVVESIARCIRQRKSVVSQSSV